jgi:antitoxin HicB
MNYHFKISKESNGYTAECVELKGCRTQGDDLKELEVNMNQALNLYLDEAPSSELIFPEPNKRNDNKKYFSVGVDPEVAFAITLKNLRSKHKMTQKEAAQKLGLKNLFSYQRLEKPGKANPALSTIKKIKALFPELSLDGIL